LVSDIENKPEKRLPELNLAAEILGMKKPQAVETGPKTVNNFLINPQFVQALSNLDAIAKTMMVKNETTEPTA